MADTARLLGVSVYRSRTMLRSSSSSLVAFTVSLYWSRLSCKAPGPRDEHPAARMEATTIRAFHVVPSVTFAMRSSPPPSSMPAGPDRHDIAGDGPDNQARVRAAAAHAVAAWLSGLRNREGVTRRSTTLPAPTNVPRDAKASRSPS